MSKSIGVERLTSKKATLLEIGTRQYAKDVVYVNLSLNRRKVKGKGVYVDVINIYDSLIDKWCVINWVELSTCTRM